MYESEARPQNSILLSLTAVINALIVRCVRAHTHPLPHPILFDSKVSLEFERFSIVYDYLFFFFIRKGRVMKRKIATPIINHPR